MIPILLKSVLHHARYFPLWSALTAVRWRSFDSRSRGLGTTFKNVMRWFPPARRRFETSAAGRHRLPRSRVPPCTRCRRRAWARVVHGRCGVWGEPDQLADLGHRHVDHRVGGARPAGRWAVEPAPLAHCRLGCDSGFVPPGMPQPGLCRRGGTACPAADIEREVPRSQPRARSHRHQDRPATGAGLPHQSAQARVGRPRSSPQQWSAWGSGTVVF